MLGSTFFGRILDGTIVLNFKNFLALIDLTIREGDLPRQEEYGRNLESDQEEAY